ncbi:MAG TPA: TadE family protein [Gemmataceae bacterium]|nr:TadE family protein [Gemmataceae bacterium]
MALVTLMFVAPLMIGVWEVGRLIQVQQIVSNSAREGARLAGQAFIVNPDGSFTQVHVSSGTPNVHDVVYQYLIAAGLTNLQSEDVQVTFTFTAPRSSDGVTPTEPYLGEKNEPFTVTVTIPWAKVRWVNLGLINPTSVTFTVTWQMLTDDKFTVNEVLPSW